MEGAQHTTRHDTANEASTSTTNINYTEIRGQRAARTAPHDSPARDGTRGREGVQSRKDLVHLLTLFSALSPSRLAPLSRSCGLPLMQKNASRGTYRNPSAPDYQERPALPPSLFEKITRFTNAKAKAKANVGGVTQASAVCMCNSAAEMHLLPSHLPTSVSAFSSVARKSQSACSCDRWWSPSVGEGPPNRPNRALLGAAPPQFQRKGAGDVLGTLAEPGLRDRRDSSAGKSLPDVQMAVRRPAP